MKRTGFPPKVVGAVLKRASDLFDDIPLCEVCGEYRVHTIHHRRPRGTGGSKRPETNAAANGIAICGWCHDTVESYRSFALSQGWLVPQGIEPARVPVKRRGVRVLLDDEGGVHRVEEAA